MRYVGRLVGLSLLVYGIGCGTVVFAQRPADSRAQSAHTQFDDHDRQVTTDWYKQHQDHPPVGLRTQDRLTPDQESRLQPGRKLDPDLRRKVHPAPADLRRQLPTPASGHRYVVVGGHVGLLDDATQVLKDVIHLHGQ